MLLGKILIVVDGALSLIILRLNQYDWDLPPGTGVLRRIRRPVLYNSRCVRVTRTGRIERPHACLDHDHDCQYPRCIAHTLGLIMSLLSSPPV